MNNLASAPETQEFNGVMFIFPTDSDSSDFAYLTIGRSRPNRTPGGPWLAETSKSDGFTLIELMITVLVVSILAAIAIPSYAAYARRGKLAEAPATLSTYQIKMEQTYPDNGQYLCPVAAIPPTANFTYTCVATAQTFLVSAIGNGSVADVTYTVNELGNKVTASFNGHAVPASCWLVNGSEC